VSAQAGKGRAGSDPAQVMPDFDLVGPSSAQATPGQGLF
jgi:hypothetical protein